VKLQYKIILDSVGVKQCIFYLDNILPIAEIFWSEA